MTSGRVLLGVGTNVGDRLGHLRQAVRALGSAESEGVRLVAISPIYESDALLPDGAPPEWNQPYLNLAVLAETSLEPAALLGWVKATEVALGRHPAARWSPREIDIDLLAMDGQPMRSPTLTLPHRDLLERPFALLPVADLVPGWPLQAGDGPLQSAAAWAERLSRARRRASVPSRRVPL